MSPKIDQVVTYQIREMLKNKAGCFDTSECIEGRLFKASLSVKYVAGKTDTYLNLRTCLNPMLKVFVFNLKGIFAICKDGENPNMHAVFKS